MLAHAHEAGVYGVAARRSLMAVALGVARVVGLVVGAWWGRTSVLCTDALQRRLLWEQQLMAPGVTGTPDRLRDADRDAQRFCVRLW